MFKLITCQLDTAATSNVLSVKDYHKLGDPPLKPSHARLSVYEGTVFRYLGPACWKHAMTSATYP